MEKLLGVLFCGGRGTRLGEITKYISKPFVPVYDKPVFRYGLTMLEKSKYIDEILILTNNENDKKLKQLGYKTIIQDDDRVFDMFSGWDFIKEATYTKKNAVLVPSDNISNIDLDLLIEDWHKSDADLAFLLFKVEDKKKLSEMGSYDPDNRRFYYKQPNPTLLYGIIAPYIIKNNLKTSEEDKILNHSCSYFQEHFGFWFDIGDHYSIITASNFIKRLADVQI